MTYTATGYINFLTFKRKEIKELIAHSAVTHKIPLTFSVMECIAFL